jgi:hypothetical protein
MRLAATALALVLGACGGGEGEKDGSFDWIDTSDPGEVPVDVPRDDAGEPDVVVSGAGQFRIGLPSEAAPGQGLAMRVSHPAAEDARHPEGAPVVVVAPGGHGVGSLGYDEIHPLTEAAGVVVVLGILPGGGDDYGHYSTGTFDYRGPACKQAFRDMIRYAMGEIPDGEGHLITDRVPWAAVDLVGVVGMSNGGNLVLTTLADHAAELEGLGWFAAWESPIGDQYADVELGDTTRLNPLYVPGTCTATTCPWPGFEDALAWDESYSRDITDPLDGTVWSVDGMFFVDADGNGVLGSAELTIPGTPGPGEVMETDYLPYLYYSMEMNEAIQARSGTLFPTTGYPHWMASDSEMTSYWAERDGSLVIADVHAALPEMLVMVLGTELDEVQGQPDHPHLRSHLEGWLDAGHAWVRANPDSAYVSAASGVPATDLPELDAGEPLPWPGTGDVLLPESVEEHVVAAAVMELADRVRAGETAADLDAVLY